MLRRNRTALLAASLSLLHAACFLGYDSRWGEAKRAQQRAAKAATPESLHTADDAKASTGVRTFRVRIHATPAYAQATVDWQKLARDTIDEANRMLGSAVGVRLEVKDASTWTPRVSEQSLADALAELATFDRGDDVELVLGFVGGLPRDATSFHEAGMAELLGKYAVVRTAARIDENVAVEKGFYELSDEDRSRLLADRAHHRAVAVLLHEVGHILGATHESDTHSLMNPRYDTRMQAFSLEATEVMHVTVSHRAQGATPTEREDSALATDLLAYFAKTPTGPWIPSERDAEVERLETMKGGAAPVAAASAAAPSADATPEVVVDPAMAAMPASDRARYDDAMALFRDQHVSRAWTTASPLFGRYPDVYAVQDLRCQLAILQRFDADRTKAECAAMSRLSAARAAH